MGWKVLLWLGFGGLFYYRHSPVAQFILIRSSEFGQYLAALACFWVKTISVFLKQAATVLNQVFPHVLVCVTNCIQVFRWHSQQILLGLLGFKSGWVVFLSWIFVLSVLYLGVAHRFRNWWSRRSRTETGPNVVNISTIQTMAANRERSDERDLDAEDHRPARRRPMRNLAGGDNLSQDMQMPNQETGVQSVDGRRRMSPEDGHGADDIVFLTRRIEANLDARNCVVCFENEKNTAVFPCGHAQMCRQCAYEVQRSSNRCPICQHCIVEIRTVFI